MFLPAVVRRSKNLSYHQWSRLFFRPMGGGPRTFPGGLNKWQWKRLHEKKAKEKEKRLLEQEKQIYEARVRSEIRAKLAVTARRDSEPDPNATNYSPMSSPEQIKALADRFMKPGAVDLWNEKDGPFKSEERPPFIRPGGDRAGLMNSPIDVKKLTSDDRSLAGSRESSNLRSVGSSYHVKRSYSVQRRGKFRRNTNMSRWAIYLFNPNLDITEFAYTRIYTVLSMIISLFVS